ncbi:ATP-binding protein [Derxia lacustris]|uniref:ATP-binding protein n=1 Tax=Derxia lacustris TaxID=764842 RepID=UPI000A1738AB|nr:YhaN family protein [Derxia lacustris]
MKLLRLHLLAFGPFTERTLDFAAAGGNLHLVTGANEAGKSSALRAMADLRFGIHGQSADDFVHEYKAMRIAGVFAAPGGGELGLLRRKGNKGTLARVDPATLAPLADPAVAPELERALTGGLAREEFALQFGIDHARLRAGGRQLLSGEAEVGAALFEASAGSVGGIRRLLDALDAEAKRHFNAHGRAESATLNSAVKAWDGQRKAARDAIVKPAEWGRLDAAAKAAEAERLRCAEALLQLRRDEAEARELKVLVPQLAEHDACARRLAALADAPELAPDAATRRGIAETELAAADTAGRSAAAELAEAEAALAALRPDPLALAQAGAIERLAEDAGKARAHRVEVARLADRAADAAERLHLAAARIAPGRAPAEVVAALPSEAEARALRERAEQALQLAERLRADAERSARLRAELDAAAPPAPPHADRVRALEDALAAVLARQAGADQRQQQRAQRDRARDRLRRLLDELGCADSAALAAAQPLARELLLGQRDAALARAAGQRQLRADLATLATDLAALRREEAGLLASGQPATDASRDATRTARDRAWLELRQAAIDNPAPLPPAERSARADDYALLVGAADRQADALHADASRAASLATCQLRIGQIAQAQAERAAQLAAAETAAARADADWQAERSARRLPALDPDALIDWQTRRDEALALGAELARLDAELAQADAAAAAALQTLAAALDLDGPPDRDGQPATAAPAASAALADATTAIAQAQARLAAAAERRREHDRQSAALAERRRSLVELTERGAADSARHAELCAGLAASHARLLLPPDATPADIAPRLAELADAANLDRARREAELARRERNAELDQLARDAETLAAALGAAPAAAAPADLFTSAPPAADPLDLAAAFHARLAAARETARRADGLDAAARRARLAATQAEAAASRARTALDALCAAAGCTDPARLPELEARAAERRAAAADLARARAELDRTAPGATPEALRERCAGLDLPALDARLAALAAALAAADAASTRAIQLATEAAGALQAIDAGDAAARAREAMEHEAARARTALRPWLRLRLAHGLLAQAMESFRERAQAPMVAAASAYFAAMTGGRYPRLTVDDIDGQLVLAAESASGKRIAPDAMSEGTADQLYLALRLAALDLRAEHDMPLVLDDVLMTSDDGRAACILGALARFARRRQVLVFTHHDHLAPIARALAASADAAPISVLSLD